MAVEPDGRLFALANHGVAIDALAASRDGTLLAVADRRGDLTVFDIAASAFRRVTNLGVPATTLLLLTEPPADSDGGAGAPVIVVGLSDGVVRWYRADTGDMAHTATVHKQQVRGIAAAADAATMLTVSQDAAVMWTPAPPPAPAGTWAKTRSLGPTATSCALVDATLIPAGHLAAAFADDSLIVWHASTFGRIAKLTLPTDEAGASLRCVAFTADGTLAAAGAANGCVYIWDVPTQTTVRIIDLPPPAAPSGVAQLALIQPAVAAALRQLIASATASAPSAGASDDGAASTATGTGTGTGTGSTPADAAVVPAPMVVALSGSGHLIIIDLAGEQPSAVLEMEAPDGRGAITAFTLSDNGQLLAVVTSAASLLAFDLPRAVLHHLQSVRSSGSGSGDRGDGVDADHADADEGGYEGEEAAPTQATAAATAMDDGGDGGGDATGPSSATPGTGSRSGLTVFLRSSDGMMAAPGAPSPAPTFPSRASTMPSGPAPVPAAAPAPALHSGEGAVDVDAGGEGDLPAYLREGTIPAMAPPADISRRSRHLGGRGGGSSAAGITAARLRDGGSGAGGAPAGRSASLHHLVAEALHVPVSGVDADARNAAAAAAAVRTTHRKLVALVDMHGSYPDAYRPLAWRFLLRLPSNVACYDDLAARGPSPAWRDLEARYPVKERRLMTALSRVLHALAQWSPVFGGLPFLPSFAFPFVKAFAEPGRQQDDVATFEAIATVLLNWGRHFVETLPHPPIPLLARTHILLAFWDAPLASHLEQLGVDPSRYAWPAYRSAFSELLPRGEWLVLWDHLIAQSHDPSLLVYALVAYMRYIRNTLLAIKLPAGCEPGPAVRGIAPPIHAFGRPVPATTAFGGRVPLLPTGQPGFSGVAAAAAHVTTPALQQVCAIMRHANAVHLPSILRMMREMRARTPGWAHPYPISAFSQTAPATAAAAGVRVGGPLRHDGPSHVSYTPPTSSRPGDDGAASDSFAGPQHPLPPAAYPPFLHYPTAIVDHALAHHRRIEQEEDALRRKKAIAELMARRTAELAAEEETWRLQRAMMTAAQARAAEQAEAEAAVAARELELVAAEVRSHRLTALAGAEAAAAQALATQRQRAQAAEAETAAERLRAARARESLLRHRMEDEALLSLELAGARRVADLQEAAQQADADAHRRISTEARTRLRGVEDDTLGEAWRLEDEERRLRRAAEMEAATKVAQAVVTQRQAASAEVVSMLTAAERQAALAAVERERRLRHAAEDANATAHGIAAAVLRQESDIVSAGLAEAAANVAAHARRLRATGSAAAEAIATAAATAQGELDASVADAQARVAQGGARLVRTRLSELDRIDSAAAAAEPSAAARVADTFRHHVADAVAVSDYVARAAPTTASTEAVVAAAAQRASEAVDDAVDMGAELVRREADILRSEIARAHGATVARPHSAPATAPQPPSHRARPGSRDRSRGRSPSPAPPSPPPPLGEAGSASGGSDSGARQRGAYAPHGISLGIAPGATVVPTPSLGSRNAPLRPNQQAASAARHAVAARLAATLSALNAAGDDGADVGGGMGGAAAAADSRPRSRSRSAGSRGSAEASRPLMTGDEGADSPLEVMPLDDE